MDKEEKGKGKEKTFSADSSQPLKMAVFPRPVLMKKLVAHTIIKAESMVYMPELFPSDELVGDANHGWKTLLSRKFDSFVTSQELLIFISDACEAYKAHKELKFTDFDHTRVAASLFTHFKHTVHENNLGFILRTKTELKYEDVKEDVRLTWYERLLPYNFSLWMWNAFKNCYNGILDFIRIG